MQCKECNTEVKTGINFCPKCGADQRKIETKKQSPPVVNHSNETTWHYMQNGNQQGPVSAEQIKTMLASGKLKLEDSAWTEGLSAWTPFSQLGEIFPTTTPQHIPKSIQPPIIARPPYIPIVEPPSSVKYNKKLKYSIIFGFILLFLFVFISIEYFYNRNKLKTLNLDLLESSGSHQTGLNKIIQNSDSTLVKGASEGKFLTLDKDYWKYILEKTDQIEYSNERIKYFNDHQKDWFEIGKLLNHENTSNINILSFQPTQACILPLITRDAIKIELNQQEAENIENNFIKIMNSELENMARNHLREVDRIRLSQGGAGQSLVDGYIQNIKRAYGENTDISRYEIENNILKDFIKNFAKEMKYQEIFLVASGDIFNGKINKLGLICYSKTQLLYEFNNLIIINQFSKYVNKFEHHTEAKNSVTGQKVMGASTVEEGPCGGLARNEWNSCWESQYKKADFELNSMWKTIISKIDLNTKTKLIIEQKLWLKELEYRANNARMEFENGANSFVAGYGEGNYFKSKTIDILKRIEELKKYNK